MKEKKTSHFTVNLYLAVAALLLLVVVFYADVQRVFVEVIPGERREPLQEMSQEAIQETTIESTDEMTLVAESEVVTETSRELPTEALTEIETEVSTEAETLSEWDRYLRGVIEMPKSVTLEVPVVRQYPQLPTGCESVALTMVLKYLGFELEKTTIAKDYLVRSASNYGAGYVGDPFSERGAGVFAPGLTLTANGYLQKQETALMAYDISETPFEALYSYLAAGYPVVIWTTMYFRNPDFSGSKCEYEGRTFLWYNNEHCVVLGGYDWEKGTVTIYDPLQGKVAVKAKTIQNIYEKTGANALVIYEKIY